MESYCSECSIQLGYRGSAFGGSDRRGFRVPGAGALFLSPFKRVCGLGLMLSIWGLGFKVSTYARLSYEEAQSKVLLVIEQVLYGEHLTCYNSGC